MCLVLQAGLGPRTGHLKHAVQIQRLLLHTDSHQRLLLTAAAPSFVHLTKLPLRPLEEAVGIKSGARNRKKGEEGHLLK